MVVRTNDGVKRFLRVFGVIIFSAFCARADSIPDQEGSEILCSGPAFVYTHDVRQSGVDPHLYISGDAGLVVETGVAYASFYTDATNRGDEAVYEYRFTAEPGAVFGDVTIHSRATIYINSGSVTGEYRIEDGPWVTFFFQDTSGNVQSADVIENVHAARLSVRYRVQRLYSVYEVYVQLFRSSGTNPGEPGDFAFRAEGTVINNADCHRANIAGADVFIDLADFAALAADYGLTQAGLTGDIDGDTSCGPADLAWLGAWWLCDCYMIQ